MLKFHQVKQKEVEDENSLLRNENYLLRKKIHEQLSIHNASGSPTLLSDANTLESLTQMLNFQQHKQQQLEDKNNLLRNELCKLREKIHEEISVHNTSSALLTDANTFESLTQMLNFQQHKQKQMEDENTLLRNELFKMREKIHGQLAIHDTSGSSTVIPDVSTLENEEVIIMYSLKFYSDC